MKKTVCLLLMLLCVILSPLTVSARTFEISDTDMTVTFDETMWYVFTRDNLDGNPELAELGLEENAFLENMVSQNMVVDACMFYEDGDYIEVLIMKEEEDGYVNLSNYSDSKVLKLAKRSFKEFDEGDNIDVYENGYKYIVVDYFDADLYLHQYVTVINGYSYSIQFQSPYEFTDEKLNAADEIVDSIRFDVDESMKEPNAFLDTLLPSILTRVGIGVAVGIVAAVVGIVISTAQKNKNRT